MTPAQTVAARLRATAPGQPDEARILAAADAIDAGEQQGWAVRHEIERMKREAA